MEPTWIQTRSQIRSFFWMPPGLLEGFGSQSGEPEKRKKGELKSKETGTETQRALQAPKCSQNKTKMKPKWTPNGT